MKVESEKQVLVAFVAVTWEVVLHMPVVVGTVAVATAVVVGFEP